MGLNYKMISLLPNKKPTNNKYKAIKTKVNGITFDSKREAAYYAELCFRKRVGEIVGEIEIQPKFPLRQGDFKFASRPFRADFRFTEVRGNELVTRIVDVKGVDTREGRLRRRIAEFIHNVTIEVIK